MTLNISKKIKRLAKGEEEEKEKGGRNSCRCWECFKYDNFHWIKYKAILLIYERVLIYFITIKLKWMQINDIPRWSIPKAQISAEMDTAHGKRMNINWVPISTFVISRMECIWGVQKALKNLAKGLCFLMMGLVWYAAIVMTVWLGITSYSEINQSHQC